MSDRLPELVVIGAMKCATSAVHRYLDAHPQISMAEPKELNFFNGPSEPPHADETTWWRTGQWHRGVEWYAAQFDDDVPLRGEASPAYTAPSSPEVPARMAALVPDVRLVYLVRDPVARAASQWSHHRRDGTEPRTMEEALLDPDSEYLSRSRYVERVEPFLEHFGPARVHVVVQERLLEDREHEVARIYDHVGADPDWRDPALQQRFHVGERTEAPAPRVSRAFAAEVADDVERLRRLVDDDLGEWSV